MQDGANTLRSLTLFVSSHFMFNILGKLQSEILSNEKREAISTLTLYSRLVRQACNFGSKELIPLREEGLFLENYLKLEKERFREKSFEYSISGFDTNKVYIQPFILQPLVELALLGSLGVKNNHLNIEFNKTLNTIRIESVMLNTEIHEKLKEKCEVAIRRLEFFEHHYTLLEVKQGYNQEIKLNDNTK
ncbi:MAG: histidine kinase [Bacteroidia bacterium]